MPDRTQLCASCRQPITAPPELQHADELQTFFESEVQSCKRIHEADSERSGLQQSLYSMAIGLGGYGSLTDEAIEYVNERNEYIQRLESETKQLRAQTRHLAS